MTRSRCCRPAKRRSIPESISRFRAGYVAAFGAVTDDDPLYEAVSAGRKHAGHGALAAAVLSTSSTRCSTTSAARRSSSGRRSKRRARRALELIADYYATRESLRDGKAAGGRHRRALQAAEAGRALSQRRRMGAGAGQRPVRALSPFQAPDIDASRPMPAAGRAAISRPNARRKAGRARTRQRFRSGGGAYRRAAEGGQARGGRAAGAKARPNAWAACCPITASTPSSASRIGARPGACMRARVGLAVLGIEHGFEGAGFRRRHRAGRSRRPHGAAARTRAAVAEFPLRSVVAGAGRSRHPYRARRRALSRPQDHRGRTARRTIAWNCNMTAASCSCRSRTSSF